jgi:diguanylate cyclase (GGDEF)-like protein
MFPGLVPLAVEFSTTLLFIGVLIYLRKSLTTGGVVFWVCLWLFRGAASLFAMHFVASTERAGLMLYVVLQIAFSMALVAIAMRLERQKEQLRILNEELSRVRREAAGQLDLDPLTGLRNRSALARWMDTETRFDGLVVVCDMDDFKQLNDRFGHLVGDEILHGVGKLIGSSIRESDRAFRWGGDEFVIFFSTTDRDLVESRLRQIEERLAHFQIRQHGTFPVHFSWGVTEAGGRTLRESLEEADRLMYALKRARRVPQPPGATPANAK